MKKAKKKIDVFIFAKLQAGLMIIVGLIFGVLYSFGGIIYDILITDSINLGTALAFFAIIGMPIMLAVFGFIIGLVEAFLYNILPKWFVLKIGIEKKIK